LEKKEIEGGQLLPLPRQTVLEGGIPKDADAEIQGLLDGIKGKGVHEAEATLLLVRKIWQIESALISVLNSIQQTFTTIMENIEFAPRVMGEPRRC
jgi:hypothetical protein